MTYCSKCKTKAVALGLDSPLDDPDPTRHHCLLRACQNRVMDELTQVLARRVQRPTDPSGVSRAAILMYGPCRETFDLIRTAHSSSANALFSECIVSVLSVVCGPQPKDYSRFLGLEDPFSRCAEKVMKNPSCPISRTIDGIKVHFVPSSRLDRWLVLRSGLGPSNPITCLLSVNAIVSSSIPKFMDHYQYILAHNVLGGHPIAPQFFQIIPAPPEVLGIVERYDLFCRQLVIERITSDSTVVNSYYGYTLTHYAKSNKVVFGPCCSSDSVQPYEEDYNNWNKWAFGQYIASEDANAGAFHSEDVCSVGAIKLRCHVFVPEGELNSHRITAYGSSPMAYVPGLEFGFNGGICKVLVDARIFGKVISAVSSESKYSEVYRSVTNVTAMTTYIRTLEGEKSDVDPIAYSQNAVSDLIKAVNYHIASVYSLTHGEKNVGSGWGDYLKACLGFSNSSFADSETLFVNIRKAPQLSLPGFDGHFRPNSRFTTLLRNYSDCVLNFLDFVRPGHGITSDLYGRDAHSLVELCDRYLIRGLLSVGNLPSTVAAVFPPVGDLLEVSPTRTLFTAIDSPKMLHIVEIPSRFFNPDPRNSVLAAASSLPGSGLVSAKSIRSFVDSLRLRSQDVPRFGLITEFGRNLIHELGDASFTKCVFKNACVETFLYSNVGICPVRENNLRFVYIGCSLNGALRTIKLHTDSQTHRYSAASVVELVDRNFDAKVYESAEQDETVQVYNMDCAEFFQLPFGPKILLPHDSFPRFEEDYRVSCFVSAEETGEFYDVMGDYRYTGTGWYVGHVNDDGSVSPVFQKVSSSPQASALLADPEYGALFYIIVRDGEVVAHLYRLRETIDFNTSYSLYDDAYYPGNKVALQHYHVNAALFSLKVVPDFDCAYGYYPKRLNSLTPGVEFHALLHTMPCSGTTELRYTAYAQKPHSAAFSPPQVLQLLHIGRHVSSYTEVEHGILLHHDHLRSQISDSEVYIMPRGYVADSLPGEVLRLLVCPPSVKEELRNALENVAPYNSLRSKIDARLRPETKINMNHWYHMEQEFVTPDLTVYDQPDVFKSIFERSLKKHPDFKYTFPSGTILRDLHHKERLITLTGVAGCGKTSFLSGIRKKCAYVTPYSLLKMSQRGRYRYTETFELAVQPCAKGTWFYDEVDGEMQRNDVDYLVLDEAHAIGPLLYFYADMALRNGLTLILLGDPYQIHWAWRDERVERKMRGRLEFPCKPDVIFSGPCEYSPFSHRFGPRIASLISRRLGRKVIGLNTAQRCTFMQQCSNVASNRTLSTDYYRRGYMQIALTNSAVSELQSLCKATIEDKDTLFVGAGSCGGLTVPSTVVYLCPDSSGVSLPHDQRYAGHKFNAHEYVALTRAKEHIVVLTDTAHSIANDDDIFAPVNTYTWPLTKEQREYCVDGQKPIKGLTSSFASEPFTVLAVGRKSALKAELELRTDESGFTQRLVTEERTLALKVTDNVRPKEKKTVFDNVGFGTVDATTVDGNVRIVDGDVANLPQHDGLFITLGATEVNYHGAYPSRPPSAIVDGTVYGAHLQIHNPSMSTGQFHAVHQHMAAVITSKIYNTSPRVGEVILHGPDLKRLEKLREMITSYQGEQLSIRIRGLKGLIKAMQPLTAYTLHPYGCNGIVQRDTMVDQIFGAVARYGIGNYTTHLNTLPPCQRAERIELDRIYMEELAEEVSHHFDCNLAPDVHAMLMRHGLDFNLDQRLKGELQRMVQTFELFADRCFRMTHSMKQQMKHGDLWSDLHKVKSGQPVQVGPAPFAFLQSVLVRLFTEMFHKACGRRIKFMGPEMTVERLHELLSPVINWKNSYGGDVSQCDASHYLGFLFFVHHLFTKIFRGVHPGFIAFFVAMIDKTMAEWVFKSRDGSVRGRVREQLASGCPWTFFLNCLWTMFNHYSHIRDCNPDDWRSILKETVLAAAGDDCLFSLPDGASIVSGQVVTRFLVTLKLVHQPEAVIFCHSIFTRKNVVLDPTRLLSKFISKPLQPDLKTMDELKSAINALCRRFRDPYHRACAVQAFAILEPDKVECVQLAFDLLFRICNTSSSTLLGMLVPHVAEMRYKY
jgi:hypothetical protein